MPIISARGQPYRLSLEGTLKNWEELNRRLPGLVDQLDQMLQILFDDLKLLNARVGNVVGPDGATDSAVALYDGVTGILLKDSGLTIAAIIAEAIAEASGLFQPLDADLTNIAALTSFGLLVRRSNDTWALRTLVAGIGMSLTNPAGDAGDIQITNLAPAEDHNLLDGDQHLDTNAHPVSKGDLVVGNSTPEWDGLPVGDDGQVLTADAGETLGVKWADPAASGTDAFVPTHIAAGDTFTVPAEKQALFTEPIDNEGTLVLDGLLIDVSPAGVDASTDVTGVLDETNGGTGQSAIAQGDLLIGTAANTISRLAKSATATRYLANTGTSNNPAWDQVNLANGVTGRLPLANETQGAALSALGVTGNATADRADITAGSDHQVLRRSGLAIGFGAVNLAQAAAVTGLLPDANLSSNVPLKNAANVFTADQNLTKTRPAIELMESGASGKSRLYRSVADVVQLTQNLSFDGTNWNLDDTSKAGAILQINPAANILALFTATAGANPRTITGQLTVSNVGLVSLLAGQLAFPATQNPSSNANTLDDYEEGTFSFTDVSGAGLSVTTDSSWYVKVGQMVLAGGQFTYPATADATSVFVGGLPFTCFARAGVAVGFNGAAAGAVNFFVEAGNTYFAPFFDPAVGAPTNAQFSSSTFIVTCCYRASA